ncbi:MAG: hypothetical protein FWD79_12445, partial [Desulfobulbus sp.]|nr:hypothetical protein [Desulfobulbus sp.]
TVTTTNQGSVNITGGSDGNTGVNIADNGNISSDGNGSSTNVTGTSDNGIGTDINGTVTTTNQGSVNITGGSDGNTGVNIADNGNISSDGNGSSTNVTGTSNSGTRVVNNGNVSETNDGTVTITGGSDNGSGNGSGNSSGNVSGYVSTGGSGGGGAAIVAGGGGILAGLVAWFWRDSSQAWELEAPQSLMVDIGDPTSWGGATIDHVWVNSTGTKATVRLRTSSGVVERKFALRDAGDGTKHFVLHDRQGHSELSFNPQTREYFYSQSGTLGGKPYTIKAHGWLRLMAASKAI